MPRPRKNLRIFLRLAKEVVKQAHYLKLGYQDVNSYPSRECDLSCRSVRRHLATRGVGIPQPSGQDEHPLPDRYARQDRLNQLGGVRGHSTAPAARAEAAPFAR